MDGVDPPCESLRADYPARAVGDRLEERTDMTLCDSLGELGGNMLLPEHLVSEGVAVVGDMGLVLIGYGLEGEVGSVEHDGDIRIPLADLIDAEVYQQPVLDVIVADHEIAQILLGVVAAEILRRHQNAEGISGKSAADALAVHVGSDPVGDLPESLVAEGCGEYIVYYLKILNVNKNGEIIGLGILVEHIPYAGIEMLLGKKPGEHVMGGVIHLLAEPALLLGGIPDDEEGARQLLVIVADRAVDDRIVGGVLAGADDAILVPVGSYIGLLAEDAFYPLRDLFEVVFGDARQLHALLVGPDTLTRGVIDEQRVVYLRSYIREYPVEQPEGAVMQGEVEYRDAADAQSYH